MRLDNTEREERERLIARITKHTQRAPRAGVTTAYLRNRLAMLERQKREGEDTHAAQLATEERTRPISFSMTDTQIDALNKLSDKTKMKGSPLVRAAIAHFARSNGHNAIARAFDNTDNEKE